MNNDFIFKTIVPKIKKILGISDISLFRKKLSKRIGKIVYHKRYNAQDLVRVMETLGLKEGSVVCIHASMMQFYNYTESAKDLIELILTKIGPEGTLVMPAFPQKPSLPYDQYVFDPNNEKTAAGHLAEVFRTYPGVLRSNNVHHSVCAIGKHAKYLIEDHTKGRNCWDEYSPWYRMCELNALIFNLGLPRSYMGTFHHCVEGILYKEKNLPYWSQFFTYSQKYKYLDKNGKICSYENLEDRNLLRKTYKKKVTRFFNEYDWRITKLSNLEIKVFYSKNALSKLISLGRQGITVYYLPSPKKYNFE